MARRRYGRTLAERFLLGYSRKLWGLPGDRLSQRVSGERLQGLDLRQFLLHTVLGRKTDRRHADDGLLLPVTRHRHAGGRARQGLRPRRDPHRGRRSRSPPRRCADLVRHDRRATGRVPVDTLVSTLPIDRLLARPRARSSRGHPPARARPDAPQPRDRGALPAQALGDRTRRRSTSRPAPPLHARHRAPEPQRGDEPPGPHVAGRRDPLRPWRRATGARTMPELVDDDARPLEPIGLDPGRETSSAPGW